MAKKTRKKGNLGLLYTLSFLVSIGPLAAVFAVNFHEYVGTVRDAVKLGFGAIVIAILMLLKALDKLKMPRRVVFEAICLILVLLFEALLMDLALIIAASLLGEALDYIFLQPKIARTKKAREREETADVTAQKVEEVLAKYIGGGGRV